MVVIYNHGWDVQGQLAAKLCEGCLRCSSKRYLCVEGLYGDHARDLNLQGTGYVTEAEDGGGYHQLYRLAQTTFSLLQPLLLFLNLQP